MVSPLFGGCWCGMGWGRCAHGGLGARGKWVWGLLPCRRWWAQGSSAATASLLALSFVPQRLWGCCPRVSRVCRLCPPRSLLQEAGVRGSLGSKPQSLVCHENWRKRGFFLWFWASPVSPFPSERQSTLRPADKEGRREPRRDPLGVQRSSLPPQDPSSPCSGRAGSGISPRRGDAPEAAVIAAWWRSKSEAGAAQVIEIGFGQAGAGLCIEGRIICCLPAGAPPRPLAPLLRAPKGLGLPHCLVAPGAGLRGAGNWLERAKLVVRGPAGAGAAAQGVCSALRPPPRSFARLGTGRASSALTAQIPLMGLGPALHTEALKSSFSLGQKPAPEPPGHGTAHARECTQPGGGSLAPFPLSWACKKKLLLLCCLIVLA